MKFLKNIQSYLGTFNFELTYHSITVVIVYLKFYNYKENINKQQTEADLSRASNYLMKSSRPNPPGNAVLRILCCTILPFRLVVYLFFMTILLPLTVVLQCIRAPCKRCCNGKPSDILHKKMIPWRDSMGGYCYQLIFDKKIVDIRL